MATQMTSGEWTETELFPDALLIFGELCEAGTARRFVVGTERQIEEEKSCINLEDAVTQLTKDVALLAARMDQSMVIVPTFVEVQEFGGFNA